MFNFYLCHVHSERNDLKMAVKYKLLAIDSHTMGEPTRVIVDGFPAVPGNSVMEKKIFMREHYDKIRTAVCNEPRGHNDMFGAIITKPIDKSADLGVVFMDAGGYVNMCVHGSIGTATVAVNQNLVRITEPYTYINLETPAGLVKTKALVKKGRAEKVSVTNVPSFIYRRDIEVNVPSLGKVRMDISFGGNFFAIVSAEEIGIELKTGNINKIVKAALDIRKAVNGSVKVVHPLNPKINSVDLVEIYGPAASPTDTLKNVVIFGKGQVDRSPCGTGTSAKIATLYGKGKLSLNEEFRYESIMGTVFSGRAIAETKVGDFDAVIPEITGCAYVTGQNTMLLDEDDPFCYGFSLNG